MALNPLSMHPPIVVVGGDALALRVCEELAATPGQPVTLLWESSDDLAGKAGRAGARFVGHRPNDDDALRAAGIPDACAIVPLGEDDHLNLEVALRARDLNPKIRIVLRQFNRTLGRKLEQNLTDCSVISLSSHSAATYASAAVDRRCFYGLQFPDIDGPLVGFSRRDAERSGVAGSTALEAERRLGLRILAVDGRVDYDRGAVFEGKHELICFGVVKAVPSAGDPAEQTDTAAPAAGNPSRYKRKSLVRLDPIVQRLLLAAACVYLVAAVFFAFKLRLDPLLALYFVTSTMTTTGYGDITPKLNDRVEVFGAMMLMMAGVIFSGIFIAILTATLTQARWVSMQGLRKVSRRGHIIVCGAGNVGSRVIDYLLRLDQQLVVIEASPKPAIVELSRDNQFDLLTGDATLDTTLDLCNVAEAEALIALTHSDTMNLEVALGARARNSRIPIVIRVQEGAFEASVRRHFGFARAYGTAALAAPALAGLAREPGARGRVEFGERAYSIREVPAGPADSLADGRVPLCVWRDGEVVCLDEFGALQSGERILFLREATA